MTGVAQRLADGRFHAWQTPSDEVGQWLLEMDIAPEAIVVERFLVTTSTTKKSRPGMYDALYLIGLTHHLSILWDTFWVGQTPAEGKRVTTDQLQAADMWPVGMPHAQDAARHLYLHLAKKGQL